jgi:hypothetical protein
VIGLLAAIPALRSDDAEASIRQIEVGIREDDARVHRAEANVLVARAELRERVLRATNGELDNHPELLEVIVRTAILGALDLTKPSADDVRPIDDSDGR